MYEKKPSAPQYFFFALFAIIIGIASASLIEKGFRAVAHLFSASNPLTFLQLADTKITVPTVKLPKLPLDAEAYQVTRLDTNTVLVQKGAVNELPIASLTKLVTAVVAQEVLKPTQRIMISPTVLATEGDTANLREGEVLTREELMHALLMISSNDAAEALARAYGRAQFIAMMNRWAHSIGATRTTFGDPSGLSSRNTSTARDITIILSWIYTHRPELVEITRTKSYSTRFHTWTNSTSFLNMSEYVGGKNGFTEEANRTAALIFNIPVGGTTTIPVMIVLLGSSNRYNDAVTVLDYLNRAVLQ